MKDILLILSGLVGGVLFTLIKNKVVNMTKARIIQSTNPTDSTCEPPTLTECFSSTKAVNGLLNVKSSVLWMKDIASIFNLRKLIIVGVIVGVIFGYGYFKGIQNKPVHFDLRGKEATIQLNEHYLKIETDGTAKVIDKEGKILKTIKVKDIPELEKALRPYGFIFEPVLVLGAGVSQTDKAIEGGVGARWFKWYKWVADACLTNKGVYPIGVSYKLTDNSAIGLSGGIGWEGDQRVLFKYTVKF
jgi:hypothetical protein